MLQLKGVWMNKLKFIKGEWYRHVRFKDLIVRIIKPITERTFEVELFTIGYNPKQPRTLGVHRTYFFDGDENWVPYDPK